MSFVLSGDVAPVDGEYTGTPNGSFYIDQVACVIYQNTGTSTATLWAAEGIGGEEDMATFVTGETPTGTIDGVNDEFTLAHTPIAGSVAAYLNVGRQYEGAGADYTITGAVITFNNPPPVSSLLLVDYRY